MTFPRSPSGSQSWLPLVLSAALSGAASAQSVVSGTVVAASRAPLANVSVEIDGTGLRVLTDAEGRFFIHGVPAGTWVVAARLVGFRAASRSGVTVAAGATAVVDFTLDPLVISLAEIVVTPSRFSALEERPISAATLSREDIETEPQIGEDLYRAITRLPGLASSDLSARFWVRGGPNEELLARLDGLDLVEPFHLKDFDGALSIIDVTTIGSLDLTTGGFTTEYGDRLTAVMNMRTLTGDADVRVSRQWRLRHGVLHAYLDVFNLYGRTNPRGYDYNISVRNGQLLVRPVPDEQLPRLPSLGVTWEF